MGAVNHMEEINWRSELESRKMDLLRDTQNLLKIKSVLDEENASEEAPLGQGVKEALDYMLDLGRKDHFTVKEVGHVAGHIEMGEGEELVGILCHVDVVPEGSGWSSDPFGAEIRDGRIFARGAIDDKGPTMAAYYAMKTVRELGLPLSKRVRMIIGTDEESDWRCVDRYFETEEMPSLGFAPDADFPIINAEKGIWDFSLVKKIGTGENAGTHIVEFTSGHRMNMVPDYAAAKVASQDPAGLLVNFENFMKKHSLKGKASLEQDKVIMELEGVSAHAMEPDNGMNAGLYLASFLSGLDLGEDKTYFGFIHDKLFGDSRGGRLNLAFSDEMTGDMTMNAGRFQYRGEEGSIGFSMRYPVSFDWEAGVLELEKAAAEYGFQVVTHSHSAPHYVEGDSFLIQTLKRVYEEETGEKAELLSIGGGTYARSLKQGVAFGPLFPGAEDIAHQKDEYIEIDSMLRAAAIYARAIYELAK